MHFKYCKSWNKKLDLSNIYHKYNIPIKLKNDSKSAGLAEFKYGSLKNIKMQYFYAWGLVLALQYFLTEIYCKQINM